MSAPHTPKGLIGIFDSSSGGLTVLRSVRAVMPAYSYVYYADTASAPYGPKSQAEIRALVERAVRSMFALGCELIILACNTASATALRDIQRRVLPTEFPDKRVLGVIVPTIEEVTMRPNERVGIIATVSTVASHVYDIELKKRNPSLTIVEYAAPELATLIEEGHTERAVEQLQRAVHTLEHEKCKTIVLGCTHYAFIKEQIVHVDNETTIISQDDIIPIRLKEYLERHDAITRLLARDASITFRLTASHAYTERRIRDWFPNSDLFIGHADHSTG
ncbi:MAG: glutamate racemase [Patescibacteria group bacterium]